MRKYKEKIMGGVFFAAALTSILAVLLICVFLFANGIPAMGKVGLFKFLAGTNWAPTDSPASFGIFPMILGSIYVTAGAIVIGVPAISPAILAQYCSAVYFVSTVVFVPFFAVTVSVFTAVSVV